MKALDSLGLDKKQQTAIFAIIAASLLLCGIIAAIRAVSHAGIAPHIRTKPATPAASSQKPQPYGALLPVDIEAHEMAATQLLNAGHPDQAIEHLLRIEQSRSGDRSYGLILATAYMHAERYAEALPVLRNLDNPRTVDSLADPIGARLGLALYYAGRTDEGLKQLESCISRHPLSKETACYLGQVLASINPASAEAEQRLQSAIDRDSTYAEARYQLGRLYMARGDYEKARTALMRAISIEPLNIRAHSRLGTVLQYLNRPQAALDQYRMALALNPDDYNTHYNLGDLYAGLLNNQEKAVEEFKKTLAIRPDHADANFRMGLVCMTNNMIKEAVEYFERARNSDPKNTQVLLQLGVAFERLGLKDRALTTYQSIIGYDALNPIALQKIRLLTHG